MSGTDPKGDIRGSEFAHCTSVWELKQLGLVLGSGATATGVLQAIGASR